MFSMRHRPEHVWTRVEPLGIDVHARVWFGATSLPTPARSPIVLIHGLGLSSRYMVPLGRRLKAMGYDALAPDLPGFGRTRKPAGATWPAGPNVREQADQLLMWMDACGIERAVLFGDSIGSQVAVDIAARFPQRVDRLILKGPTPDPRYRSMLKEYPLVVANMMLESPSLIPIIETDYLSAGMVRMLQQGGRGVDDPVETKLPAVRAPALVVRGQHDQTLTQAWAEQYTRLMPNARLVVIEGAAHNVHYSAADVTAHLMDAFLSGRMDDPASAAQAGTTDMVVPRLDPHRDPLGPPKPVSTFMHGIGDCLAVAVCLALPRLVTCGPRTRRLLHASGVMGVATALLTDYELGVVRKMPMTLHLNLECLTGLQLLTATVTVLRGEPISGRLAVAAVGVFELLTAALTRTPMGPARLVRQGSHPASPGQLPAPASASAATTVATAEGALVAT